MVCPFILTAFLVVFVIVYGSPRCIVCPARRNIFTVSSPLSYVSLPSNIPSHIKAHVTNIGFCQHRHELSG
jgi:hypothetical protein